jgi:universal stress protein E
MQRFKNILLLYGCDRATLDHAANLAKQNRAKLALVQVVKEMPQEWQHMELGGTSVDIQKLAVAECEARLKEFVAPLKQDGLHVSTKVLVGTPFLEIIREVIANKRDLVMMTAEGKGGLKERLFGSTSLHLMRKCPCPVWVMKPTRRKQFSRILAAVDPNPKDNTCEALNATIVQLASSISVKCNAEFHIAHAWTALGEGLLRSRAGLANAEVQKYVREVADKVRRRLEGLIASYTDSPAEVHLVKGDAADVIPDIAKSKRIDLLVMGTVCRTGIAGFFIGNTAEKILDKVDCSVLTVKPEGFVSPVKLA